MYSWSHQCTNVQCDIHNAMTSIAHINYGCRGPRAVHTTRLPIFYGNTGTQWLCYTGPVSFVVLWGTDQQNFSEVNVHSHAKERGDGLLFVPLPQYKVRSCHSHKDVHIPRHSHWPSLNLTQPCYMCYVAMVMESAHDWTGLDLDSWGLLYSQWSLI